ncbi:hypothetical protein ACH5RR_006952, partial [Cinchona calisaya]
TFVQMHENNCRWTYLARRISGIAVFSTPSNHRGLKNVLELNGGSMKWRRGG